MPRAAGASTSMRSWATVALLRATNTEPTRWPSSSAIQQRSQPGWNLRTKRAAISATSASKRASQPYSRA